MSQKLLSLFAAISLCITVRAAEAPKAPPAKSPKLVVQITVDQLRGDLPFRYSKRFTDGGFRLFMDQGVWYASANHQHAYNETIVGHTTLATGAWPSRHGMIANRWYDQNTNSGVENIEDANYPVLSIMGETPSLKGASPVTILTTTFSDELLLATNGAAKVFSVSVKDRGAVPMAGHGGKAFWYSDQNGCFVTSTYYYSAYPAWVTSWCGKKVADQWANKNWDLLEPKERYLYKDITNVYPPGTVAEQNMATLDSIGFKRTFPHPMGSGTTLYRNLTLMPQGDDLTALFAKELIRNENLGDDDVTDYLAISFSLTDYISHWFSPSSLESEDNLLRLDRTLQDFFAFLSKEVGLENTLIVLAGDHGGAEYPEYLSRFGINTGRIPMTTISDTASQAVAAEFNTTDKIVQSYSQPYLYLDRALLEKNNLTVAQVEAVVAKAVNGIAGVMTAVPMLQLTNGGCECDPALAAQLLHNYHRDRSGDVQVVQYPQWQIDGDSGSKLLQHNSVWFYDTFVPIAFVGMGLKPSMVHRQVSTTDVAPTLSAAVKTKHPSGSVGLVLREVAGE